MAILFSVDWAIVSARYGPINDWPTERIHKSRALPETLTRSIPSPPSGQVSLPLADHHPLRRRPPRRSPRQPGTRREALSFPLP